MFFSEIGGCALIIYAEISSKVYAFRNLAFNVYGRNFFILSAVPKLRDKNVIGTNFCIYNQRSHVTVGSNCDTDYEYPWCQ